MAIVAGKRERDLQERRQLGAYYTPERLSDMLAFWAIRSRADLVLEPSFGGCGFLQSAVKALKNSGSKDPKNSIYGCDIDTVAFDYLCEVLGGPADLVRFVQGDFLTVERPEGWPESFDVVMGNPPYIPYQKIEASRREELNRRIGAAGKLGGRAGLWAYFVAHSIARLKSGGRMAWVLPGAFVHAEYASALRDYLTRHFTRAAAFVVHDRLFLAEGTDEETIILLADGHSPDATVSGSLQFGQANALEELASMITDWDGSRWSGKTGSVRSAEIGLAADDAELVSRLISSDACRSFGEFARLRIGIVTGANDFFLRSNDTLQLSGLLAEDCEPIVSKFRFLNGLGFNQKDFAGAVARGAKGYLVNGIRRDTNERIDTYLKTFPETRIEATSTFKKRSRWDHPSDANPPDAFFPVMNHLGPRIVLNELGCNCTNTLHRVYFHKERDFSWKIVLISILTSFAQVSAEMVGRRYGSGVLKHEPREAETIKLLMPRVADVEVQSAYSTIDALLRAGEHDKVIEAADDFIYSRLDDCHPAEEVGARMRSILSGVRRIRHPKTRALPPVERPHTP
ncbi:SAM-dependent methyltransferase [Mesorhizobium sp. CA13]|uniref:N-6 DNA methylase n=1 Tax=unclassified Mesorhizobium TaxID=325217 RepID=UPI001CCF491D|nr:MULTISPECIES: N-6 DNA methylase [unclassified Mesorhizobium]MBZ9854986.1 SAM-dependent methyltransferase [Mesorhizobium sp. CA13]MBZ9966062.1 SAM-dependent methyltransferase [Mesorhizobium sp. BR1-1-2]